MVYVPIHRKDFRVLAELRIEEARILLRAHKPEGAYYLAGYAVECALKACIARKTKKSQFPPDKSYVEKIYTHRLDDLMKHADLDGKLIADADANANLWKNWETVKDWTEQSRYKTAGLDGKSMYNAVAGSDGVLPWIKRHW